MRMNVEKVLERDQKLSELDDRAGNTKDEWLLEKGNTRWTNSKFTTEHYKNNYCTEQLQNVPLYM